MEKLETPCFIFHDEKFANNISCFKRELDKKFKESIIGYSFKTNSLPYIIDKARELGCYAEVVSDTEYQLALRMGYAPDNIIFNGPIKSREQFFKAFLDDSIINIDSMREISWLQELDKKGHKRGVGIRVNFDVEKLLQGQTAMGEAGGRFGFSLEKGELHKAIEAIKKLNNIELSGLHMHISSKSKSVEVYEELARCACKIACDECLALKYIDIGGGFFGGGDDGEAYSAYIEKIHEVIRGFFKQDIMLIVEPGASVVADTMDYVAEVIDVKDTSANRFVITDGSRLHLDTFFHKQRYQYSVDCKGKAEKEHQVICGYTCMENDRFMELKNETELQIGDRVYFKVVGSYTMCFSPLFIEYFPVVYSEKDGCYKVVREKWGVEEYLQKNYWGQG